jgi:hypothetical protein
VTTSWVPRLSLWCPAANEQGHDDSKTFHSSFIDLLRFDGRTIPVHQRIFRGEIAGKHHQLFKPALFQCIRFIFTSPFSFILHDNL